MRLVTMMALALLLPALAFGQFGGFGGSVATPGFNGSPVSVAKQPATAAPTGPTPTTPFNPAPATLAPDWELPRWALM